jgi:hypothetical protein
MWLFFRNINTGNKEMKRITGIYAKKIRSGNRGTLRNMKRLKYNAV